MLVVQVKDSSFSEMKLDIKSKIEYSRKLRGK